MLCLFINFYKYLLYVFEVDGVPIAVMELVFIFYFYSYLVGVIL